MLTKRPKEVLEFVKEYSTKHKYAPSLEEIRKRFRFASVSTAHFHIQKLQELGFLRKEDNKARSINVLEREEMVSIPLVGTIAAGQPIEAIVEKETITIAKQRMPRSGDTYALRVSGNSMIEENVEDGDIVVVRSQSSATNGDKVVALIDNERATLKTYHKERNEIRLQPANKNYDPIILNVADNALAIQGVVVDVIKSAPLALSRRADAVEQPQHKTISRHEELPINQIICGDVIDEVKKIPDKSIDLIVADPPYNLSQGNSWSWSGDAPLTGFGGKWAKVMESWDSRPLLDYFTFTLAWVAEARRVLKPTGSIWVFGTYHNIGAINMAFQILGVEIINEVVWYKRNAFPNLSGRRFTASHETLLWAHAGGKRRKYFFDYEASRAWADASDLLKASGKQMRTVWDVPNNKERRELKFGKHPTQKPLSICKRIIALSSEKDAIVLSPFAGVGSECLAANELGRKFIGIEMDRKYVEIAQKRLANAPMRLI